MTLVVPDGWGWRVVNPDGSTEAHGPPVLMRMAGDLRRALGIDPPEPEPFVDTGEGLMVIQSTDPYARTYEVFIK